MHRQGRQEQQKTTIVARLMTAAIDNKSGPTSNESTNHVGCLATKVDLRVTDLPTSRNQQRKNKATAPSLGQSNQRLPISQPINVVRCQPRVARPTGPTRSTIPAASPPQLPKKAPCPAGGREWRQQACLRPWLIELPTAHPRKLGILQGLRQFAWLRRGRYLGRVCLRLPNGSRISAIVCEGVRASVCACARVCVCCGLWVVGSDRTLLIRTILKVIAWGKPQHQLKFATHSYSFARERGA